MGNLKTVNLLYLAFLVAFFDVKSLIGQESCAEDGTYVPDNSFDFSYIPDPPHQKETFLQIYESLRVPCSGTLTEFRFYVENNNVNGLHLAVFRAIGNGEFLIAGDTHLTGTLGNDTATKNTWVTVLVDPPVDVIPGDFLGIYYDDLTVRHDEAVICSKILFDILNTRVLKIDAKSGQLGAGATVLAADSSGTYYSGRYPLLTAFIAPKEQSNATTPAIMESPTFFDPTIFNTEVTELPLFTTKESFHTTHQEVVATSAQDPETDLPETTAIQQPTTSETEISTTTFEAKTTTTFEANPTTAVTQPPEKPLVDPRCFISINLPLPGCMSPSNLVTFDQAAGQCLMKHGCLYLLDVKMTFSSMEECKANCKALMPATFVTMPGVPTNSFTFPPLLSIPTMLDPNANFLPSFGLGQTRRQSQETAKTTAQITVTHTTTEQMLESTKTTTENLETTTTATENPETTTTTTENPETTKTTKNPDTTTTSEAATTATQMTESTTSTEPQPETTTTEQLKSTTTTRLPESPVIDPRCFFTFNMQMPVCQSRSSIVVFDRMTGKCQQKYGCFWNTNQMTFASVQECTATCARTGRRQLGNGQAAQVNNRPFAFPPAPALPGASPPSRGQAGFGNFLQQFLPRPGQNNRPSWPSLFPG